jgi:hypothetical protein
VHEEDVFNCEDEDAKLYNLWCGMQAGEESECKKLQRLHDEWWSFSLELNAYIFVHDQGCLFVRNKSKGKKGHK